MRNIDRTAVVLTEGGILKTLVCFAVPVLLGNIFQQLYNVADTAIIGNILGDKALAAIGAAAPVYGLLIGFAGGLTNGFGVIIARYFGADDKERMNRAVALTYLLSAATAVLLTAVSLPLLHTLMTALKTPSDIIADTEGYIGVIMLFSTFTVLYNMMAGMMRAVGNSRTPLYFLIVSALLNVGLDLLFVKVFGMGVKGAAYATAVSQGVSVVLCFVYAYKKCRFLLFSRKRLKADRRILSDLISTGMSMGLMYAIVSIGSVILQGAVNSLGTDKVTAHIAARKIDDIFMQPIATVSLASSTFSGQNYGAGRTDRVKKGILCGIGVTTAWSAFSAVIVLLFGRQMICALTGTENADIISAASDYIIWNISFFAVLGVLCVLRSSLQGVGRKLVPVGGSVAELLLKIAAAAVVPSLGYFGVCITEPVIWIVCAAAVTTDYFVFLRKQAKENTV